MRFELVMNQAMRRFSRHPLIFIVACLAQSLLRMSCCVCA